MNPIADIDIEFRFQTLRFNFSYTVLFINYFLWKCVSSFKRETIVLIS